MLFNTLTLLILFAAVFAITAGLARDSQFLIPMAGILVLTSGMLLTSASLDIQDGKYTKTFENTSSTSYSYDSPNGKNTTINVSENVDKLSTETPVYSDLNTQYSLGPLNLSGSLAFVLLAIALYSFILAGKRKQ